MKQRGPLIDETPLLGVTCLALSGVELLRAADTLAGVVALGLAFVFLVRMVLR